MQSKAVVLRFTGDRPDFKGTLRTFMSPVDQVAFERHYGVGMGKFSDEERIEWVLWLVWRAYAREQHDDAGFEAFIDELDEFDLPDENLPPEALELARRLFADTPELEAVTIGESTVSRELAEVVAPAVDPTRAAPPG